MRERVYAWVLTCVKTLVNGWQMEKRQSDLLGPGHMMTKKYGKVWVEHKKVSASWYTTSDVDKARVEG